MDLRACYGQAGGDYADVMARLGKEERVSRFLGMFLRDKSYEALTEAMAARDYGAAFRAAHTLKGVCMNLSLAALQEACGGLTENLRAGQADGRTQAYFEAVQREYGRTAAAIRSHL